MLIDCYITKKSEELKALYHTSTVATRNRNLQQFTSNLWQIASTIILLRYSLPTLATLLLISISLYLP